MIIFDILGWIGTFLVLLAYCLLSLNKIPNGKTYQILNFFAALCMGIGLFPKNAWFSFFLQVAWGIIAIFGLIKLYKKKKNQEVKQEEV